jgi:hypothetical protein
MEHTDVHKKAVLVEHTFVKNKITVLMEHTGVHTMAVLMEHTGVQRMNKHKGSHQSNATVFNNIHKRIILGLHVSTTDGSSSGPHNTDPDINF